MLTVQDIRTAEPGTSWTDASAVLIPSVLGMNPLTTRSRSIHTPAAPPARTTDRVVAVVLLAATAAAVLWMLAVPALGVNLAVTTGEGTRTVGIVSVLVSATVATLAGWATLALLGRWAKGRSVWAWGAVVLASLSLLSPLTMAHSTGAAVTLVGMHVAVAAVAVPGLLLATVSRR